MAKWYGREGGNYRNRKIDANNTQPRDLQTLVIARHSVLKSIDEIRIFGLRFSTTLDPRTSSIHAVSNESTQSPERVFLIVRDGH